MEDSDPSTRYRRLFDAAIAGILLQALRIIRADPSLLLAGTSLLMHQRQAAATRGAHEKEGLFVPPVMIVSITSRCNLACTGCYMKKRREKPAPDMSPDVLKSVVSQAAELGVSVIVIAGGEPLVRKEEIADLARSFPQVLFPVFTNGLLIDEDTAAALSGLKNIVPVISFEGFRSETDLRRGSGVYDRLLVTCSLLKARGVFFGCSITVTRENTKRVLDEPFIRSMLATGARAFVFVEYVPIEPGTEDLVLTPEQRKDLCQCLSAYIRKFPALFIGFPGDEEEYGGCLAAGRGFVHISPSGGSRALPGRAVLRCKPCKGPVTGSPALGVPAAGSQKPRTSDRDKRGLRPLDKPGMGAGTAHEPLGRVQAPTGQFLNPVFSGRNIF
jgi:MoaA/NifB/PqqE/SkfB family radical SAM enzyme